MVVRSNGRAASLSQDCVSPKAAELRDTLSPADFPKAAGFLQPPACIILGKRCSLERPDTVGFRLGNCCNQESPTDAEATRTRADVDADLRDSGIAAPARDRTERGPTQDASIRTRHEPGKLVVRRIPFLPGWSFDFEGGLASDDSLQVDGTHVFPI